MATTSSLANAAAPATSAEEKIQTATQPQNNTANQQTSAAPATGAAQVSPTTGANAVQATSVSGTGRATPAGPNTQPTTNPQNQTAPQAAGLSTITTPSGRQSTLQDPSTLTNNMQNLLNEWRSQATTQQENKIDYNVQRQTTELQRQVEDAQALYKEQQDQIARGEANAKDNAALYAEARGDRGGIGQAQYNAIQNTAAQNRLAVAQAQTKLATDVNRQINDLRAQGEFEKADAALEISQNYLSQLMTLQQWAANYGISYDQFQEAMFEWQNEYEMSMAQILGQFADGTKTLQGQQYYDQQMAMAAQALIEAGIAPTEEMLAALGITGEEADAYIKANHLKSAEDVLKGNTGGGGGGGSGGSGNGNWINWYIDHGLYDPRTGTFKDAGSGGSGSGGSGSGGSGSGGSGGAGSSGGRPLNGGR